MNTSTHYTNDRKDRENVIDTIGTGKPLFKFEWRRPPEYRKEVHIITSNAIILVYNADETVLITKLIARPAQISRYFNDGKHYPPTWLLEKAKQHRRNNYNSI